MAKAPNAAARKRLIEQLEREDPGLLREYEAAKALAERTSFYLRQGGRFPLGGAGDVNFYVVFAELLSDLVNGRGQSGILCPSGIATDDTTKALFGKFAAGRIASLYDFENREKLFDGIDSRLKFCLLTVRGWTDHDSPADFAFFSTSIDHLREPDRHFTLTAEDFALFNPNTRTCPVFRSKRDAEIARKMYRRAGVFWKEARGTEPEENPWGVKFSAMFHMSNDSGLFRTREELERDGYALKGNVFVHADGREYLPLYEAKLFHQYDHRFATFDGASKEDLKAGNARDMTAAEKADPEAVVIPRYWVPAEEVAARLDSSGGSTQSLDARRSTLDARRSTLDARRSTLDARRSTLDARSSKLEALATGVPTDRPSDGRTDRSLGCHPDSRSGSQRSSGLHRLVFRSIARATDERTMVAAMICPPPLGNSGIIVSLGCSASETSLARPMNEPQSHASSKELA